MVTLPADIRGNEALVAHRVAGCVVQTRRRWSEREHATRWSTSRSSKVNLPHAINFRALCGTNLVTYRSSLRAEPALAVLPLPPKSLGFGDSRRRSESPALITGAALQLDEGALSASAY